MSPSTACRVGGSFSRCTGITGKSCLIAHESGIDWNSEKLQKYVSASVSSSPCRSSGTSSICWTSLRSFAQIAQ
jgi:hypothetical protein